MNVVRCRHKRSLPSSFISTICFPQFHPQLAANRTLHFSFQTLRWPSSNEMGDIRRIMNMILSQKIKKFWIGKEQGSCWNQCLHNLGTYYYERNQSCHKNISFSFFILSLFYRRYSVELSANTPPLVIPKGTPPMFSFRNLELLRFLSLVRLVCGINGLHMFLLLPSIFIYLNSTSTGSNLLSFRLPRYTCSCNTSFTRTSCYQGVSSYKSL